MKSGRQARPLFASIEKITMNMLSHPMLPPLWQGGAARCIARHDETHDSASFTLASDMPARFDYKPGQFVTLAVEIDGQRHHRAYSISSSPLNTGSITITVKRVAGGLVSNFLLDNLHAGQYLEAGVTAGEFYLSEEACAGPLVMLSAGSGVTPVMAMARWLLALDAEASIHFILSARSEQDIIFRDELLAMQVRYPNFRLDLFLDNAEGQADRHAGFLTPERLDGLLTDAASCHFYLCGNPPYMAMIESWYRERALPADRFHKENFTPEALPAAEVGAQVFELAIAGFGKTAAIVDGQTLLEVLEASGVPLIAACRAGVCGSCKCKVISGQVERASTATLTEDDLSAGLALACSTRARSCVTVELLL